MKPSARPTQKLSGLAVASVAAGVLGLAVVVLFAASAVGALVGVPFGPATRVPFLLVVLTLWVPSAVAVVLGFAELLQINADPSESRGKGVATAGITAGLIGLAVFGLFLVVVRSLGQGR